jgi:dihydrofolate synthase / folylpolyglutamate synthase
LDAFAWLFGLEQFGIKFGLDNIRALVERLGHPERTFRSVHIAGTNGKGSVTAMVDAALRAAGHRSARYTSPHLVDLTERFAVDGRPVDRDALAAVLDRIRAAVDDLRRDGSLEVHPTFFEVTTAAAFELFRRARVEAAVLEVGLGGRLDATNVVVPDVTAITSIAFDHEQYLGSTLRDIALEKAGIIKAGVPVVIGPLPPEADAAVVAVARERRADLIRSTATDANGLTVGLAGPHQRVNAGVAVRILRALDARGIAVPASAISEGLAHPAWPGRLDLRRFADGREVLLDAAHNPAGAEALASYLSGWHAGEARPPLIFGTMRDKDAAAMLRALIPAAGPLVLTRASTPRAADPDELAALARRIAPTAEIHIEATAADALDTAWRLGSSIVAAGSIFLLGDIVKLIEPS